MKYDVHNDDVCDNYDNYEFLVWLNTNFNMK